MYRADILDVELRLTEPLLGSKPDSASIWELKAKIIERRHPIPPKRLAEELELMRRNGFANLDEDEGDEGEDKPPKVTVFARDESGLFLWDYEIKGMLKEAANDRKEEFGIALMRDKVEKAVYVYPRRVYLLRDGEPVREPDDILVRPLRGMTAQGPRISVVASELVREGVTLRFQVHVLANGRAEAGEESGGRRRRAVPEIRPDTVAMLLAYGQYKGLGQWRNGSWGRFEVTRCAVVKASVAWSSGPGLKVGDDLTPLARLDLAGEPAR